MYRFGGTQGTFGTLWYLRDLWYLWYHEEKRQVVGQSYFITILGYYTILRYIVESDTCP